jgi:LysM repeat protein
MPLRMLAPLALGLFAIGLIIVVIASLGGSSSSDGRDRAESRQERTRDERVARRRADRADRASSGTSAGTTSGTTAGSSGPSGTSAGRRFYVVQGGDTLGTIAQATGVPIDELLTLNPSVDPQGLVSGQRIKLRE